MAGPRSRRDAILASLDRRHAGLRPFLVPDIFTGLVRGISAQQVNLGVGRDNSPPPRRGLR